MAKILFIQLISQPFQSMFYLCGALKNFQHEYRITISKDVEYILDQIEEFNPSLLGFSMYSGYHLECLEKIKEIRNKISIPVIVGGPHPTFFPEIIKSDGIDIVCRGEGEVALVEIMDRIDRGEDYNDVQNLLVKKPNGDYVTNDVRRLIDPLDSLPFPDFGVYLKYPIIMDQLQPCITAVRGCPYSCTYCYNDGYQKIYRGKGKFVRTYSPERTISEIKEFLRIVPDARIVDFPGDCFGLKDKWLEELMPLYRNEIGLPFSCLYRPEIITDKKARLLSSGGCYFVAFGIESGSERIRKSIMKRSYSNEDVIRAAKTLKKHGIKFRAYNMVGLPTENYDDLWETVNLNIRIKPDMPWCSFYTPYPGTKLAKLCVEHGLVPRSYSADMLPGNFHLDSILDFENRGDVINTHHFFQSMVLFPVLMPIWKLLMRLNIKKLNETWFKVVFLYCRIKSDRPRDLLKYSISMIKSRV